MSGYGPTHPEGGFLRDANYALVVSGATAGFLTFSRPGALTVLAGTARFYVPAAITLLGATASVGTAPTGASVIVDVNKNGTTVFTTQANRPTVAISGFVSAEQVPDVTASAAGDYLTIDVDQVGSTIAGADLTVTVRYQ